MEVSDIVENFQKLPQETQKTALENGWAYFSYAFNFPAFQQRVLKEFPSLAVFDAKPSLLGRTPLDLRLLTNTDANPVALLLAIDLEMEMLSRFHSNTQNSPRCLETFWTDIGLTIPRSQASVYAPPLARLPAQNEGNVESPKGLPLNERSRRLSLYLKQSLGLAKESNIKLVHFEDPIRAQFILGENEAFEIFASPIDCKVLAEKKHLIPQLGKMKCLQKQSAAWITVPAKESTVVSDDWVSEVKTRCQKWSGPLADDLKKGNSAQLKNSPIPKSWSLYPRLRNFVMSEADRYGASFRQSL